MPPLPSIKLGAPEIRAAIASLTTYMPQQVAVFNAEPENTVDLVAPQTYHFGATDRHASFPFPQTEVAVVQGRTGRWTVARSAVDHDPWMNVVTWIEGTSGEVAPVYEQLLGMARCVIEVLSSNDALGPGVEIAQENGIYWRLSEAIPLEQDDSQRELKTWRVPVFVQLHLETVVEFG